MKKLFISILLLPLLFTGCNKKKSSDGTEPIQEEQYINVNVNEISLVEGETFQIEITQLKKTIVLCQSNNDAIATVTQEGLVTAVAQGETSITITGGKDHFIIFVTVLPDEAKDSLQIVMVKNSFTIAMGDEYVLPFIVKYGNQAVENPTFSYTYEKDGVVSISGLSVTPLSVDTTKCVVTATYNEMFTL